MPGSDILTAMPDEQLGRLAMIEAMRANTDAVNRLARHGEMQDTKLDAITAALGRIDTRLSVLEVNPLAQIVAANTTKIEKLEADMLALKLERGERVGAGKALDAAAKYGPMALALVGFVFIVMVATGRLVL